MSDPKQIEHDIREYLEKEPNLKREDRMAYLQTIFNKHLEVTKLDHLVNYSDLFLLFSDARTRYVNLKVPVYISKKLMEPGEAVHMAVMEAFIMYLNSKNLLKKLVKFDYRQ